MKIPCIFKADDASSSDQVAVSIYDQDTFRCGFIIASSAMETGKWTAVPVDQITIASDYSPPSLDFRTSDYYTAIAYASTIESEGWGTLWRSETSEAAKYGSEPDSADVIQLPSRRAASLTGLAPEPAPLYEMFINGELPE